MDVNLALEISRLVHNECKDVPHDIGLRIVELVEAHQHTKGLIKHEMEQIIREIKNRIECEFRKHEDLDWAGIAARKIYLSYMVDKNRN